jgi:hypothetical protein
LTFTEIQFKQKAAEGMAKAGESSFDDDIMESDIELEGEVVEPDNDLPQKVRILVNSSLIFFDGLVV